LLCGAIEWDDDHCRNGVVMFRRVLAGHSTVVCVANMGNTPTPAMVGELLCSSGDVVNGVVPPDTTAWFATRD
jgi:hypothetical protein